LEDFRGRYYGPLASDPTEDPNGNPPTAGDFYFNTTGNIWRIFNGSEWKTASELVNLGTAATADIGTAPENVPTNADLGTAAMKDVEGDGGTVVETQNLGTAARQADTRYAHRSNNLNDLANAASALINLGFTATASEINQIADGITATAAQVNQVATGTTARNEHKHANVNVIAGTGLSGGGNLGGDITLNVSSVTVNQSEIENRAVGQGELKTASGSVQTNSNADTLLVLPGGAYGFYPRIYSEDDYHYAKITICGETDITINNSPRPLICMNSDNNYNTIANQYYIQASPPYMIGDTLWGHFIFLLRNKNTGAIVAGYEAEDPPWAYNGPAYTRKDSADRIRAVPHPFADYENRDPAEDGLEIILCNTEEVNVGQWRADVERPGRRGSIISEVPAMLTIDEKTPIAAAKNLSIPGFTDRVKLLKARAK
jgi:hypothetical protein